MAKEMHNPLDAARLDWFMINIETIDRADLARYIRGAMQDAIFNLPELENMDTADYVASVVVAYLREKFND